MIPINYTDWFQNHVTNTSIAHTRRETYRIFSFFLVLTSTNMGDGIENKCNYKPNPNCIPHYERFSGQFHMKPRLQTIQHCTCKTWEGIFMKIDIYQGEHAIGDGMNLFAPQCFLTFSKYFCTPLKSILKLVTIFFLISTYITFSCLPNGVYFHKKTTFRRRSNSRTELDARWNRF